MDKELYIIWTSDNIHTSEQMVFGYSINAMKKNQWDKITIIILGGSAILANRNPKIQKLIKKALELGIIVSACSVCADQLQSLDNLEEIGIEIKHWGDSITQIIQDGKKLLTF